MLIITYSRLRVVIMFSCREFPLEWMTRHLEKSNFQVLHNGSFSILHSEDSIYRQIRVAELKLDYMLDSTLREGMQSYLNGLK